MATRVHALQNIFKENYSFLFEMIHLIYIQRSKLLSLYLSILQYVLYVDLKVCFGIQIILLWDKFRVHTYMYISVHLKHMRCVFILWSLFIIDRRLQAHMFVHSFIRYNFTVIIGKITVFVRCVQALTVQYWHQKGLFCSMNFHSWNNEIRWECLVCSSARYPY